MAEAGFTEEGEGIGTLPGGDEGLPADDQQVGKLDDDSDSD